MTFFALLFALLIEHVRPLAARGRVVRGVLHAAHWLEAKLNGGKVAYGALAWGLFAVLPALIALGVSWLLAQAGTSFAWAWEVLVLVLVLGFRGLIGPFGDIEWALLAGDMPRAKRLCREWFEQDAARFPDNVPASDLASTAIAQLIYSVCTRAFSVICWYLVLGIAGAVLVRLTLVCANVWKHHPENVDDEPFAVWAVRVNHWLQWPAVRLTALAFAITGQFDRSIKGWRERAARWPDLHHGIPIEAAAGALGTYFDPPGATDWPSLSAVKPDALQSVQGLVWRALGVWMLLALLVTTLQFALR